MVRPSLPPLLMLNAADGSGTSDATRLHMSSLSPAFDLGEPANAGALALPVRPVPVDTSCQAVYERLVAAPHEPGVVVVDPALRPLGLVSRHTALARYAERYGPQLYGRKPVTTMMDESPLMVDEKTPINELGRQVAVDHPTALVHGFVVTSAGCYQGIGTGQALIRVKVERDARQTHALREALSNAARAQKAMSNFLAMMSHELRTPLNAIIGFADILRREQFGALGLPRYVEYAHDIYGAGSHLLSLISDILDLSKAEAGRLELHAEPVSVPEIIGACVRLVAQRTQDAGLSLSATVADDLPALHADALKLKQIVLNLLSNAVNYTLPGGAITIAAAVEAGEMVIRISDSGIGIAEKDIPVALSTFGQVQSPLARKASGTGLGLPLVKALVRLHSGRFALDSAVGVGTTATVTFPRERIIPHQPTRGE